MANIFWNAKTVKKKGSSNYDSAGNWNPHAVPTAADVALFSSHSRARVISITKDDSVGGWTFSSPGYTFTIKATASMNFVGPGISGGAKIVNNNELTFSNGSKAGFSTIITNKHATTSVLDSSTSDNARFTTNAGGAVDFSAASAIMRATMIAGAGKYYLGDNQLIVGATNLSGKVTGGIFDGDPSGGGATGASVVKEGSGTLALFGHNIYTGGTIVRGGTLDVGSVDGAGTGDITLDIGSQTLKIQKSALTSNTFATEIHDMHAGDFIVLPGLKFKAGASATYHGDTDVLDITSGAVIVHLTLIDPHLTDFKLVKEGKTGTKIYMVGEFTPGGPGDDILIATAAAEDFDGLAGNNTVSYQNASGAVVASLASPQSNTGWAEGDLYTRIQNLTGGAFDDILKGDAKANVLTGGAGKNTLDGGAGNDVLVSSSGKDILKGGTGADHFKIDGLLGFENPDPSTAVFDFSRKQHDKIDLRGLETTLGTELFYVGHRSNFTHSGRPEVGFDYSDGVSIYVDSNGAGGIDLILEVYGIYDLKASDLLL